MRAAEIVRAALAEPLRHGGAQRRRRVPRVRARHDGGGQRRDPAGAAPLHRAAAEGARRPRLRARAAGDAGQRRHGRLRHRRRARGRDRDVGPGLGRDRRRGDGAAGGRPPGEFADVVTYDMGGTSSDVALVLGGMPSVSSDLELEYAMPIHVPMVDVHTIGAGGGSIASVDAVGHAAGRPRERRARRRGRSATAAAARGRRSPTPTSSSAGSIPERLLAVEHAVSMESIRAALRRARRRAARPRRDRRGGGDRPRRQRQDGRRDPHGEPGARPRSARLRAVRVRRRRAAARGGAGAGAGDPEAADPGAAGPHQRARLRRRRPAPRLRRHRQPAARSARRGPRRRRSSPRRSRAAATLLARENVAVEQRRHAAPRRHAVPGPEPHPAGGDRLDGDHASPSCAKRSRRRTGSASASSCRRSGRCSSTCTPR